MEAQQLSFKIHPHFLEQLNILLHAEAISFTFKYQAIGGPAGYFLVTIDRPVQNKFPFELIVTTSEAQISKDKEQVEFLVGVERDYERIRSDMKALIFHASLSQPAYKSTEKRKDVFSMLHSELSKQLRPPLRKRAF